MNVYVPGFGNTSTWVTEWNVMETIRHHCCRRGGSDSCRQWGSRHILIHNSVRRHKAFRRFDTGKFAQPLTPFPGLSAAASLAAANRWSAMIKGEAEEKEVEEEEEAAGGPRTR